MDHSSVSPSRMAESRKKEAPPPPGASEEIYASRSSVSCAALNTVTEFVDLSDSPVANSEDSEKGSEKHLFTQSASATFVTLKLNPQNLNNNKINNNNTNTTNVVDTAPSQSKRKRPSYVECFPPLDEFGTIVKRPVGFRRHRKSVVEDADEVETSVLASSSHLHSPVLPTSSQHTQSAESSSPLPVRSSTTTPAIKYKSARCLRCHEGYRVCDGLRPICGRCASLRDESKRVDCSWLNISTTDEEMNQQYQQQQRPKGSGVSKAKRGKKRAKVSGKKMKGQEKETTQQPKASKMSEVKKGKKSAKAKAPGPSDIEDKIEEVQTAWNDLLAKWVDLLESEVKWGEEEAASHQQTTKKKTKKNKGKGRAIDANTDVNAEKSTGLDAAAIASNTAEEKVSNEYEFEPADAVNYSAQMVKHIMAMRDERKNREDADKGEKGDEKAKKNKK